MQLEERFGLDLTGRKAAIKALTIQIISEKNKEGEAAEDEDEEEEEVEEEEESGGKKRRRGGGGFAAMVRWSDKMAEFLGTDSMPRTQVTKELWKYIKEKELQKPGDRRVIVCDDALNRLFNVKVCVPVFSHVSLAKNITLDDVSWPFCGYTRQSTCWRFPRLSTSMPCPPMAITKVRPRKLRSASRQPVRKRRRKAVGERRKRPIR